MAWPPPMIISAYAPAPLKPKGFKALQRQKEASNRGDFGRVMQLCIVAGMSAVYPSAVTLVHRATTAKAIEVIYSWFCSPSHEAKRSKTNRVTSCSIQLFKDVIVTFTTCYNTRISSLL